VCHPATSTIFLKISEFTPRSSVRSMHGERNIACGWVTPFAFRRWLNIT